MKKPDAARSAIMRTVKSKNTKPEMIVRRLTHAMGYRYRLHRSDLPGKPDLTFSSRKKVIFVHGCFWHGHKCRRGDRMPKTNRDYWRKKLMKNQERDASNLKRLEKLSWKTLVIWECELKDVQKLKEVILEYLEETNNSANV